MSEWLDRLTVFAITVGDQANFERCIARLDQQTIPSRREVIENVAPMSAAFNQMHARCETELFVQVDEDVLLQPWAVERLAATIDAAAAHVCQVAAPLWDVQIERPIYGVKIYRHAMVSRFPFENTAGCDRVHNAQLEAAGFGTNRLPLEWSREACFGEHGTHYTPEAAYDRWRRMFVKRRLHGGLDWIEPWPARFLERYRRDGDPIDLYSFLGAASALTDSAPADSERDFREEPFAFQRLQASLAAGSGVTERIREGRERILEAAQKLRGFYHPAGKGSR